MYAYILNNIYLKSACDFASQGQGPMSTNSAIDALSSALTELLECPLDKLKCLFNLDERKSKPTQYNELSLVPGVECFLVLHFYGNTKNHFDFYCCV